MIKISGLDTLTRTLEQAQQALEGLSGELNVRFDSTDPESIENAIREAETMVDEHLSAWADNLIVAGLMEQTKLQFRQAIIDRAAQARLESDHHGQ